MIGAGLAAVVLLASLATTYFFCLRPMKRGHCAMAPRGSEREIAELRAEVKQLRNERAGEWNIL